MGVMKDALICDLDSTLCNSDHRQPLADQKRWQEFHEAHTADTVNKWCMTILEGMRRSYPHMSFFFISGRPNYTQESTEHWMQTNLPINVLLSSHLYLRPHPQIKGSSEFKRKIYEEKIKDKYRVLFCLDDDINIIKLWRELGLVALDCAGNDYP
jgi:hypothetical protein